MNCFKKNKSHTNYGVLISKALESTVVKYCKNELQQGRAQEF